MSKLIRFEIDKNYLVIDPETKAFYADLSIRLRKNVEEKITHITTNFENEYVKLQVLSVCKTALGSYICSASGYVKVDVKDYNDAIKVYRAIEDAANVI